MQVIQASDIILSSFQFCLFFFLLDLFLDEYFLLAIKLFIEKCITSMFAFYQYY